MSRLFGWTLAVALSAISCGGAGANNPDAEKAADAAARQWLERVDKGQYGESWDDAASVFRGAITREAWTTAVKGVREPLGAVASREPKSAKYTTSLPGAPDGEYVVIQYNASFANKKSAVETITPMKEPDGSWRVSGYFIK